MYVSLAAPRQMIPIRPPASAPCTATRIPLLIDLCSHASGAAVPEIPDPHVQHVDHDRWLHFHHLHGPCAAHGTHIHNTGAGLGSGGLRACVDEANTCVTLVPLGLEHAQSSKRVEKMHLACGKVVSLPYGISYGAP